MEAWKCWSNLNKMLSTSLNFHIEFRQFIQHSQDFLLLAYTFLFHKSLDGFLTLHGWMLVEIACNLHKHFLTLLIIFCLRSCMLYGLFLPDPLLRTFLAKLCMLYPTSFKSGPWIQVMMCYIDSAIFESFPSIQISKSDYNALNTMLQKHIKNQ